MRFEESRNPRILSLPYEGKDIIFKRSSVQAQQIQIDNEENVANKQCKVYLKEIENNNKIM